MTDQTEIELEQAPSASFCRTSRGIECHLLFLDWHRHLPRGEQIKFRHAYIYDVDHQSLTDTLDAIWGDEWNDLGQTHAQLEAA